MPSDLHVCDGSHARGTPADLHVLCREALTWVNRLEVGRPVQLAGERAGRSACPLRKGVSPTVCWLEASGRLAEPRSAGLESTSLSRGGRCGSVAVRAVSREVVKSLLYGPFGHVNRWRVLRRYPRSVRR